MSKSSRRNQLKPAEMAQSVELRLVPIGSVNFPCPELERRYRGRALVMLLIAVERGEVAVPLTGAEARELAAALVESAGDADQLEAKDVATTISN